jgi:kynurenine formamidase
MALVDLSHDITEGMVTYPGLPTPHVATHLSREESASHYAPGVTFHIGVVTMCTNTGTYLDTPFHRYEDGYDLTGLPLERVADVPGVVLDARGRRVIDLDDALLPPGGLAALAGRAVLVRTDHSDAWGTDAYAVDHPHLTAAAARALAEADVACVGIDSLNIDGTATGDRPVHSILLAAGIPVVEHLTNLRALPRDGFRFTAVPPRIAGAGTYTVRAFASCP